MEAADLAAAFADLDRRTARARAPWWIIGSAAVVLHGAATDVADLDLLMDAADARAVLRAAGVEAREGERSALFGSAVFGTLCEAPLPIEVMADFAINTGGRWEKVAFRTREPVRVGSATLWVPSRAELIALLRRFGREKDVARAALLEALPPG